jgi:ATP-dependent exoDNAse (exonuclease V) beta subunit
MKYLNENSSDISQFIEYWEEEMCFDKIASGEIDGIRILSVHSSKGLEFKHVLIPYCDWEQEINPRKAGDVWVSADQEPYNRFNILPVKYGKEMQESIYEKDFLEEQKKLYVDNLNLLYVAFTRACKNLFIYGKRGDARYRSYIIEQSLPLIQQEHLGDCVLEEDPEEKDSSVIFTYGTFAETKTQEEANESKNIFNKKETAIKLFVETFDNKTEFQQSNKSREYISENDDEEKQNTYIKIGNILHGLLASIHTIDDLDKAITQLENEGILETEDITIERIKNLLDKRMKNPTIMDWFSNRWSLYNECSILYIDPETNELMTRRPDRVMTNENETIVVDFKFGSQKSEHFSQVKDYMALLNNMNHKHVKGYLWYVYSNNIIEVK